MQNVMTSTLRIYKWPSQAFWRYFEVQALRNIPCESPILEIGCGDGRFSSLVFDKIEEGIDVNPRAIERCRNVSGQLYGHVRCLDVRTLSMEDGGFATVYANCVLEHVAEIKQVLTGCFRGLRPGGQLVVTVPLVRMNHHLLLPWRWYSRMRQRQLVHINLMSETDWEKLLLDIGFSEVQFRPYLSARACRFWDMIDSPGCVGVGRYRLATVLGRLSQMVLSTRLKTWLIARLGSWLSAVAEADPIKEPACATVVIARKNRPQETR
jgi:SAM-dependent methyltransferase